MAYGGVKNLLIGEAPGKKHVGGRPFTGKSGKRLNALLGVEWETVMFGWNLLEQWPGKQGVEKLAKGDAFPVVKARDRARELHFLLKALGFEGNLLLCGKRVGRAFGVSVGVDYFVECTPIDARWAQYMIPHVSGINRWWNDPKNVEKFYKFRDEVIL